MLEAAARIHPLVEKDIEQLQPFGLHDEAPEDLDEYIRGVRRAYKGQLARKNDTPLQMAKVAETMAQIRSWMQTLQMISSINLALDTPALYRISSPAPQLNEGYARDLLKEFKQKLNAAADLLPRLSEVGLTNAFLSRGRQLNKQLSTAIGDKDLNAEDLQLQVRSHYMRKANLFMMLKRIVRAGQVAFISTPERAQQYHLDELEPRIPMDPKRLPKMNAGGGVPSITRPLRPLR